MASLSDFTDEQAALLISLPYKTGVWISYSDDAEGEDDDEREMKALRACLRAVAKLHEGHALISEIMTRCLQAQDEWSVWAEDCFHVPPDAFRAMEAVKARAPEKTAKAFRAVIMEIATAVAQAHGEFGEFGDFDDDAEGIFGKIVGAFAKLGHDDKNHPMNVSAAEDSALAQLAEALKI
jgi:hypothetical protein